MSLLYERTRWGRGKNKHAVTCWLFLPRGGHSPSRRGDRPESSLSVTRAGPDPRPWMVGGEGGLQGDALDRGAPARLTPCPAGGAPQEGEGQPQQHGFWLESQGLLGRRGQAIPSQRGASPDLVGPRLVGVGPYRACGVLWSRPGAGSLVPGHPPLGP